VASRFLALQAELVDAFAESGRREFTAEFAEPYGRPRCRLGDCCSSRGRAGDGRRVKEASVRYLCLLVGEPDMNDPAPGSAEFFQMLSDYQSATAAMADGGVLVDSGPLQPPSSATTIRVRDGESLVTDGPFAEIKEQIGGYYVLDCADLDEALRWATTIPAVRYGAIEVRPLMVMPDHG
jgi:hypothetical protein